MPCSPIQPGATAVDLPALLPAALDRLEEGLAVFDDDLLLVYCNAPFRALRDYPAAVCTPGAHISTLYRHNAARGDYHGEEPDEAVAVRVGHARARTSRAFDQRLADGTVLHVRYQPIGGGLLFSYEDVSAKRGTERALASSELRAAAVAEATSEGIYEWRINAGELHPSPRLAAIFGLAPEELNPSQWEWNGRVHPEDFERYRETLLASLKDDAVRYAAEYRVRTRAGDYMWVMDRGVVAERNEQGRATRFIGTILDVSDRKRVEEALRISQERYARAVEAVNEGVYEWDIDTGGVYFSDRVRDVLGLTPSQLATAKDWQERIHPDDRDEFGRRLIAHLKGDSERFSHEFRYRRGDGSWGWARQHGIAVRDDTGRAVRMTGATGDVSPERAMAAEVEALRARLLDALEALSEGFVLFDADDRLVMCNEQYRRYFPELMDRVAPGAHFSDIIRAGVERGLFPAAAGGEDAWLAELLARRGTAAGTREQHMANGLWLQVSDHRTSDGGLVSVYTDITELKRREVELTEAKEAAETTLAELTRAQGNLVRAEKMAALGQLTAGIAHEIKNPLNFVNNFARTSADLVEELGEALAAARDALDEAARENVDDLLATLHEDLGTIRRHGERADGIVRGMLLHSRRDGSEREPTDLNALLEESLNLAYHGQRATVEGFNVTLDRQLDPAVGLVAVLRDDLRRVFVNLLGNAFYAVKRRQDSEPARYSPSVTVTTRRTTPDEVEIRVRDNGTGMAPETLQKLFTPFFTTKPPGEGTGLGLSISHDIVAGRHAGSIRVESEVDAGTEFTLVLPDRTIPHEDAG